MAYGSLNSPRGVETEEEKRKKLAQQADAQRMLEVNQPLAFPANPHQMANYGPKRSAEFVEPPFGPGPMDQFQQLAMMKGADMGLKFLGSSFGLPMSGGGKVPAYADEGTHQQAK